jgi:oligopeptide/dipeptide ABC transporter ATP-binding protein
MTARAIVRLDQHTSISGRILFEDRDLLSLTERELNAYRGAAIGMVFQDPMSSLDPLMTIGDQIAETLRIRGIARKEARDRAIAILDELGVREPRRRFRAYPHEFSGGMRQRVGLAMALIGEPRMLIADEPTTALDVRVQEQVLDLIDDVTERRRLAVLLITHNLGVVAGFADRVLVMYAGRIVEEGPVERIFADPAHPYTSGLLAAVPRVDKTTPRLASVPGTAPALRMRPPGCAFHPRCPVKLARCSTEQPAFLRRGNIAVACHLHDADGEVG